MQDDHHTQPATKADVQAVKADVQSVKADVQSVKANVQSVKSELKADVQAVKANVQKLSETVTRLAVDLAKTQGDVRQIKDDMATRLATKDDISRIMGAIDAFAAQTLSYQNHDKLRGGKIMEHETKIEDHESRLTVLEANK